jgi:Cu(I)/Ag(I) efflux system membrane fusion protein
MRQTVLVAKGQGRFEPRAVRIGGRSGGQVHILSGLAAGEEVVVGANFLIDAESNLRAALQTFSSDKGNAP